MNSKPQGISPAQLPGLERAGGAGRPMHPHHTHNSSSQVQFSHLTSHFTLAGTPRFT